MTEKNSGISVKRVARDTVEGGVSPHNGLSANGITHQIGSRKMFWDWDRPFPDKFKREMLENPEMVLKGLSSTDRKQMIQAMREMAEELRIDPGKLDSLR